MKWNKLDKKNPPTEDLIIMRWKQQVEIPGAIAELVTECAGVYKDDFFYPSNNHVEYDHVSYLIEMDAKWMYATEFIIEDY